MIDGVTLAKRKLNKTQMLKAGFLLERDCYVYQQKILDNEFLLSISIDNSNVVTSFVSEVETGELYTLYNVKDSTGGFVAKMRNAYNSVMDNVVCNCSVKEVYKSKQALEVIDYVKKTYDSNLEFLWNDDNCIARNGHNKKWYLVLMVVNQSKLGLPSEQKAEILNLRMNAEKLSLVVDGESIFCGYHMNKKHWVTILLNDKVDTDKILSMIDDSYNISLKR